MRGGLCNLKDRTTSPGEVQQEEYFQEWMSHAHEAPLGRTSICGGPGRWWGQDSERQGESHVRGEGEEQTMKTFDRSEVLDVTSAYHARGAEEKRLRRARMHELLERCSG